MDGAVVDYVIGALTILLLLRVVFIVADIPLTIIDHHSTDDDNRLHRGQNGSENG
jgi:hypothetical protein